MDLNPKISSPPPFAPSGEKNTSSPTPEPRTQANHEFSDEEILEKFRTDDTRHYAFNLLVRQYQRRIYWHIRRILIDHEDSNDVIQEVFIKVWTGLYNFRGESRLFTWLYTVATNEALSFLKKKKRRAFLSFRDVEHEMAEKLSYDPLFTGDKIQLRLQQALLKLPARQRVVFNMKYFDGMKYEDISEILGVTVGALKASYHHAVKKIARHITV